MKTKIEKNLSAFHLFQYPENQYNVNAT